MKKNKAPADVHETVDIFYDDRRIDQLFYSGPADALACISQVWLGQHCPSVLRGKYDPSRLSYAISKVEVN